jgi:glycine/D-amino acid oxidase-like deaminating enzyme
MVERRECDVLIIGGGLFGCLAARAVREAGRTAVIVDAGYEGSGSPPAACVWSAEWAKDVPGVDNGTVFLARHYGLRELTFTVTSRVGEPKGERVLYHVTPALILDDQTAWRVKGRVLHVAGAAAQISVRQDGGEFQRQLWSFERAYVATGYWTQELVRSAPKVTGKAGVAMQYEGSGDRAMLVQFAPYRQLLAFERDAGLTYVSDGTAIKVENYKTEHTTRTLERVEGLLGFTQPRSMLYGVRPYVDGGPWFSRVSERVWCATGGRKLGTIAGAAFAHRFAREAL